jgi:hypothetical protein
LISRLADGKSGDLNVELTFFPTPSFPTATGGSFADIFLVDFQDENGLTELAMSFTSNTVVVPIGSGKTVLVGLQPNAQSAALYTAANAAAQNPATTPPVAARGYVMIDVTGGTNSAPAGVYNLVVTPEIRATFLTVTLPNPPANLLNVQTVAYSLPTPNAGLVTLTKTKDTKDKDTKDIKDKDHKEIAKEIADGKSGTRDKISEKDIIDGRPNPEPQSAGDPAGIQGLADRLAALEDLVGSKAPFIKAGERPKVG